MSDTGIRLELTGGSATVVLDRPEHHNRVGVTMMRALIDALDAAAQARVVLFTATGEDFSLGRDQQEKPAGMSKRDNLALVLECNRRLNALPGVTVAAVQGHALGFGSGLAVQCDITVAAATAQLGFDEVRHGFPPTIVMGYLEDLIGRRAAADLILTGRHVSAAEARSMGLVSRVCEPDELDAAAGALVHGLLELDATALRRSKQFQAELRALDPADRPQRGLDLLAGPA